MRLRRFAAVLVILCMAACMFSAVQAESEDNVPVLSAPLRRVTAPKDGMVRVWLSSLGTVSQLNVTVTGNYSVNGNTAMSLSTGDQVVVTFDAATGNMTMSMKGKTYAVGQELRLRRHQAMGESAVSIAQAKRPGNLYPGDLQLLAVKEGDAYRLYPIVHVYLEYYLYGVVPYEMSSSWPIEALKAQAVAARTYTLRKLDARSAYRYDMTDTASDQVYYGYTGSTNNATLAVDATKGIVAMNDGVLTGTYYTASNGGQTEAVKNAWGGTGYAYLGVKNDPFDAANPSSIRRKLTIYSDFDHTSQNTALTQLLSAAVQAELGATAVIQTIDSVTPHTPKYAAPSRLYTKMDFGVTATVNGVIRKTTLSFGIFDDLETPLGMNLNSTTRNELWTAEKVDSGYLVTVGRWGHGIGMSQRGAQRMAQLGYTYDQILGFYYEGCERVQYTFTHTILSAGSSSELVSTEAPATISPGKPDQATVSLVDANDTAPLRYVASETGKLLTGIPNGAGVTVLAKRGDWTLVKYGEINGYLPTNLLIFSGTPPTATTEKPTQINIWGTVTGTNALNFRVGAGYDYAVQAELPSGTVLCILGTSGEWVKAQHGSMVGYVSPDYLTMHSSYPGSAGGKNTAMVSLADGSAYATVLASPSMEAAALRQLAYGTQVTVLSNDGTWCQVSVSGVTGYVLTSQLDFDAKATVTTSPTGSASPSPSTSPSASPAPTGITAWVMGTVNYVNLRETASSEGKIITTIPSGDELSVLEKGGTWSYILHGSVKGYVLSKHLTYSEPLPAIGVMYINTVKDPLALRDQPTTSGSKVLTRIPKGTAVMLLENLGDWCRVQHDAYVGYCSAAYLSRSKPTANDVDGTPLYDATLTTVVGWTGTVQTADRTELTLYKWCSIDAPEVKDVPYAATLTVQQRGDIWCKVVYKGVTGYCLSSDLIFHAPAN